MLSHYSLSTAGHVSDVIATYPRVSVDLSPWSYWPVNVAARDSAFLYALYDTGLVPGGIIQALFDLLSGRPLSNLRSAGRVMNMLTERKVDPIPFATWLHLPIHVAIHDCDFLCELSTQCVLPDAIIEVIYTLLKSGAAAA